MIEEMKPQVIPKRRSRPIKEFVIISVSKQLIEHLPLYVQFCDEKI